MSHLLTPKQVKEKSQQSEWVQYGYKWGERNAYASLGRDIKAILDSHASLFEMIKALKDKYLTRNDQGGMR